MKMLDRCKQAGYLLGLLVTAVLLVACGESEGVATAVPTAPPTVEATPTIVENLPQITAVMLDRPTLPRYESVEMVLDATAEYSNPYDAREVTLEGTFT
ncbi:MAG: DUF5060 domain-containing protein, partial [Anaerolineae bacterium]|nr:DUF5060 domain-containing protein [Anaerolineae bacterium]